MTDAYRRYQEIVNGLRAKRAVAGWKPEDDRQDLAQLMDLGPDVRRRTKKGERGRLEELAVINPALKDGASALEIR